MSLLSRSSQRLSHLFKSQVRFGTTIRVLLIQNLPNKGIAGEVVAVSVVPLFVMNSTMADIECLQVKRGYFRNLLYPRKIAGELFR